MLSFCTFLIIDSINQLWHTSILGILNDSGICSIDSAKVLGLLRHCKHSF